MNHRERTSCLRRLRFPRDLEREFVRDHSRRFVGPVPFLRLRFSLS